MYVADNASLTNVDGFSSLTSVGEVSSRMGEWGHLFIGRNASLMNVDGLSSLTSVGESLHISENASLTNVDGLSSVTSLGDDLYFTDNPALARCAVGIGPILARNEDDASAIGGRITIRDNAAAGDCTSAASVLQAFGVLTSADEHTLLAAVPLSAAPNPARSSARLSFALDQPADVTVTLYDLLGRQVAVLADERMQGSIEVPLDVSQFPSGVYVARLVAGERVETVRLSVVR